MCDRQTKESIVEINDLTIAYGDKVALKNFNLRMEPGEVVALVGESGSGKSTVVRGILGLLPSGGKVTAGEIYLKDRPLSGLSEKERQRLRGKNMAMIFQDSGNMLNPVRTIGSQFTELIRTHENMTKDEAWELAERELLKVRLIQAEKIMKSYPFELSGGQRQRVGIAMGMVFQPQLLLADEPTSALDVTTQARIVHQMMELKSRGSTGILLVTHNLGVAMYMADEIYVMKQGEVVEIGTRDSLLHSPKSDYTRKLLRAVPTMEGEPYV